MRRMMLVLFLVLLTYSAPQVAAQSSTPSSCPQLVTLALASTDELCDGTGLNQACYGHVHIDAVPRAGVATLNFETQGDVAAVQDFEVFRLSSMDPEAGTWGVALLNVLAYLQYTEPQAVTYLLFGDVQIEDATEAVTSLPMVVSAGTYVNARIGPHTGAGVLAVLAPGQAVEARARTADSSWIWVVLPDSGRMGWVGAALLAAEGDVSTLNVADGTGTYYGPMQAFSLQTGENDAPCPESPESGLLIQTPEGVAEVSLLVNEVTIDMQATVFLQAQPSDEFRLMVVDGWAEVEVDGRRQPVFAGSQVRIPLDESGQASGPPSLPEPYVAGSVQALPVQNLPTTVEVSAPLSEAEVAASLSQWQATQQALYNPPAPVSAPQGTTTTPGTAVLPDGTVTSTGAPAVAATGDGGAAGDVPPSTSTTPESGGGDTSTPPDSGGGDPPPSDSGGRVPPGHGGTPPGQAKK